MNLTLIAAIARDGGIGIANGLPWRLRKDLLRFKANTMGHPIIMGRKTWESLRRPLPGRRNIVISRNPDFVAEGAEVADSLPSALQLAGECDEAFVIGGAQVYAVALPYADRLLITEVDTVADADAYFPSGARAAFREISREHHPADAENEHPFDFVEYRRAGPI